MNGASNVESTWRAFTYSGFSPEVRLTTELEPPKLATSITDATGKIHSILEPFESDERHRIVSAALVLLGEAPFSESSGDNRKEANEPHGDIQLPPAATRWLKKNGLTTARLEQFFHFDDNSVEAIELPGNGKSARERVIHTYLMMGIASLLQSGAATFTDTDARAQCEEFGCYDSGNHTKYTKFGNKITGSKTAGWKLTAPGLTAAAVLLTSAGE